MRAFVKTIRPRCLVFYFFPAGLLMNSETYQNSKETPLLFVVDNLNFPYLNIHNANTKNHIYEKRLQYKAEKAEKNDFYDPNTRSPPVTGDAYVNSHWWK